VTIERAQVWLARYGETQRTRSGQHTGRTLTACWIGRPSTDGRLLALDPAAIGALGWERETRLIQRWNLA
jgi:hypothetical protein